MKQKEALYNAVKSVKDFEDGSKVELTKDEKKSVVQIVVAGFKDGSIDLKSKQENLEKYSYGLLTNWLAKDKRMNGNVKHEIKNKGSRAGQGDAMVKNLRILRDQQTDEKVIAEIDQAIADRLAEIKPKTEKTVDLSVLPAELVEKLGLNQDQE